MGKLHIEVNDENLAIVMKAISDGHKNAHDTVLAWRSKKPGLPIPIILPTGRDGGVLISPEARDALKAWAEKVFESDDKLRRKLKKAEWNRYVFKNFFPVQEEIKTNNSGCNNFEKCLKKKLKSIVFNETLQKVTFIFPAKFARRPLSKDLDLGVIKILSYTSALTELKSLINNIKSNLPGVNCDKNFLEEWKHIATGYICVSIQDIGFSKSEQWAKATANFMLSSLLLPVMPDGLLATEICEEIREDRKTSQYCFTDSTLRIRQARIEPKIADGDVIHLENWEYAKEWMGFATDIATGYLNDPIEPTDDWQLVELGRIWFTALHWFHRASNSDLDFEVVMQLGICLDTLCGGGRYKGIVDLACAITGKDPDDKMFGYKNEKFKKFLKDLYDNGRSRIAHGTIDFIRCDYSSLKSSGLDFVQRILISYAWSLIDFNKSEKVDDNYKSFIKFIECNRRKSSSE